MKEDTTLPSEHKLVKTIKKYGQSDPEFFIALNWSGFSPKLLEAMDRIVNEIKESNQ